VHGLVVERIVQSVLPDQRLENLYQHWLGKRRGRRMPARADIDPLEIPADTWPHTMLLDVIWERSRPRFRYRRVGEIFWRGGREPTGMFIDEVVPETAGYRRYVVGLYEEMAQRRCAMYSENSFTLAERAQPMVTKRVALPLSTDGDVVNMVLAGHVFEHGTLTREIAFSLIRDLRQLRRDVLE
jgi:hypothetical protein